jgi:ABC-2 type transport system permease protein
MNYRRTKAMARKELLHIVRDPRSLIMALAVPMLLLLLFSYALSLDVDRIPTIVYDQDGSPQSRQLAARFSGSRYFNVIAHARDYKEVERAIDLGECIVAIVFPSDFSHQLSAAKPTSVQVLLDGTDSNTASIALAYAESIIGGYSLEIVHRTPPAQARIRVWYNTDLKSRNFIVPGLVAVILMIIAALLTSLTIAREWENGTMEQLLSTPLRPIEIITGKLAAFFLLGIADSVISIVSAVFVFDVPLRGNLLLLGLSTCIFLVGVLTWGLFISSISNTQLMAYQVGLLSSFLPGFLLSGFIYAIESMPSVIQAVTYIVPARYFVTILKAIFLKGVGVEVLWRELLFLVAYALIVVALAVKTLKKKVA